MDNDKKIKVAVAGAAAAVMTVITLVMYDSDNSESDDECATLSTQLGEMASAIKSWGQSNIGYSELYDEVMKVDGYDEVVLRAVFDYLVKNEKIGKAFMVKSANLQKVWIDKFLSKGEHNQ